MIRYPKAVCGPDLPELAAPIEEGRGVFIRHHQSEVLLMTAGGILPEVLKAAHLLNMRGISTDILPFKWDSISVLFFRNVDHKPIKYFSPFFLQNNRRNGRCPRSLIP